MKSLTLVDGSGYIFRAYHALPPLTNPQGTAVGAVYGFVNMLSKLISEHENDAILVVFDAARNTFRNRIYEQYKANRDAPPDDLIPQFGLVREAAIALGLEIAEVPDFEADDVIATYTRVAREAGLEVTIVSSDKDLMQLIGDGVCMYDAMKQKKICAPEVIEKFGVPPEKVIDVLSLMGDSSDNVPGVPGIGPKTAAELIQQYGSLDELLARAGEIKQPKRRETLLANIEQAKLSRELILLRNDVELPHPLEALSIKMPDPDRLTRFLEAQGFRSLITRLKEKFGLSGGAPLATKEAKPLTAPVQGYVVSAPTTSRKQFNGNYELVQNETALLSWIKKIEHHGVVAVDVETTALDPMLADLVGISLCVETGEACYIPLGHMQKGSGEVVAADDLFAAAAAPKLQTGQMDKHLAITLLKPILEDASILKIGHNIKYDMLIFKRLGIHVTPIDDTMLMSYALYAGLHPHGMDEVSQRYLGHTPISYDEVTGTGRTRISFAAVELEKARDYAAEDADITMRLYQYFFPMLHEAKVQTLYQTIERPLIEVVTRMEERGIEVDKNKLVTLSSEFEIEKQKLETRIYELAGETFNVGSPKQLGEILFDKMQLGGGKKSSKTGAYSTDSYMLEELVEQGVEIASQVLEWRQLSKLKSTYTDALVKQIHPKTKRVHTNYSLAVAATGRLSSSDPNLQNIPIRTELGRQIRTAFIAKDGSQLISADYSQIELRLLAHMAEIDSLKQAFKNGIDIHTATASDMFGMPIDQVSSDARRSAKMINFGIIYGMSAHGLAIRLNIGRSEAGAYIAKYFEKYPGILEYMERTKEFARKHGYVTTLFGRRCHVPYINDRNAGRRQFSERAAINAPLQGTAADIIKIAMCRVEEALKRYAPNAQLLLQVHDELVVECPDSEVEAVQKIIIPQMEHAANLTVPLTVDARAGKHWGEVH